MGKLSLKRLSFSAKYEKIKGRAKVHEDEMNTPFLLWIKEFLRM
jgi:hypothetical protein